MRELPKGWEYETLGKISSKIGSGSTPRGGNESYQASGIPLIRSMNVHFDGLKYDGLAFLDDSQAEKLKNVEVLHDDVLLNITGASIGRVAIAPKDMSGARVNQHVSIIRLIHYIDPRYVRNFIASPEIQSFILETEAGVTRQALTKEKIENLEIPLPPLNEQKRIADRLDLLLTRIDKTKAHLDRIPPLLKRFRQSVLAAATSGKLTEDWREANGVDVKTPINGAISPDGDFLTVLQSMDYEIPDAWEWTTPDLVKADEKHSLSIGPFGSNLVVKDYRDSGVPLVFVREIRARKFGDEKTKYVDKEKAGELWAHRVEPGDLLITKMGDPPGDVAILPKTRPISIITSDCIRLKVNPKIASAGLLSLFVESDLVRALIQTITAGVAQQKISLQRFRVMPFPLPPLLEQHEIVRRVETLFAKADRIEAQYQTARQAVDRLTPALLAKAFRGELVPQDPNDEPASVLLDRIKAEKAQTPTKVKRQKKS